MRKVLPANFSLLELAVLNYFELQTTHQRCTSHFLVEILSNTGKFHMYRNINLSTYTNINPLTAGIQIKGRAQCADLLVFFPFFI